MFARIRKSLTAKVSIAVTLVLFFFISVLTVVDIYNETSDIIASYRRNADILASTIEKGLVSSMKDGRNEDVQKALEDIGTQEEIDGVRIFDERGNILRSTNRGELGGMVEKAVLDKYLEEKTGSSVSEDLNTLVFVKPIYNSPQCFACHPSSKMINGVLNINISMEKAYSDIKRNRSSMLKLALLMLLCVGFSEIWLLRRLVGNPVGQLKMAMRKAENGEAFEFDIKGEDELKDLGQAFKDMMERISVMGREAIEKEKELVRHNESQKAHSLLSSVIDGIPDGVTILDKDMRLTLVNPGYVKMFPGASPGDVCYRHIHRRESVCPHCGVAKVFSDGKIHEHESTVLMPDGSSKVVHSISAPIFSESGEVINAVEVIRDITDRVTIEKELKEKTWELERANTRLAKMAVTDGLTMLFNHRYFQDSLKKEFKRLARHRALPLLSIAMIDIDHFKGLNDAYGHQAGDSVLKGISKILKGSVRLTDVVARYGGEEFVIIMPETDFGGTAVVAERIRQNIENAVFEYKDVNIKATVSIGLAGHPHEGIKDEADLIKAADSALYTAKQEGRNRVVVWKGV